MGRKNIPYETFPNDTVLKPCPFCGSKHWELREVQHYVYIDQALYDARCAECKIEVLGEYYGMNHRAALDAVIKAINRRKNEKGNKKSV